MQVFTAFVYMHFAYTIYRKENRKREFMYAIKRFANREKS